MRSAEGCGNKAASVLRSIIEKLRPAKALQAAQTIMMRDHRLDAPFYWAAFTLLGERR